MTPPEAMREEAAKACEAFGRDYEVQWGERKRFEKRDLQRVVRDVTKLCAEDIRALPLPPVVEEVEEVWQPISSAPRDGTQILLFFPTYAEGAQVGAYQYDDAVEPIWDSRDGYQIDGGEDAPTHWMPLPNAPCTALQRTGGE